MVTTRAQAPPFLKVSQYRELLAVRLIPHVVSVLYVYDHNSTSEVVRSVAARAQSSVADELANTQLHASLVCAFRRS